MAARTLLHGATVVFPEGARRADILIEGAHIADVADAPAGAGQSAQRIDCTGATIVPGFIDMHVHGGGGADFSSGDAATVTAFHGRRGTTTLLASLACRAPEALIERAAGLAAAAPPPGAAIAGVHFEGPFLNPARAGVHPPEHLRRPDVELAGRLADAAAWGRGVVTLAPELPGAGAVIHRLRDRGVLVAVGHSDAGYDDALTAFAAGAGHVTHLGNAMAPLHHRNPGAVQAALDHGAVSVEVIGDGVHVHPSFLRLVHRMVGRERMVLVSDAVAPCGCADGDYVLGDRHLAMTGGVARVAGTDALAGGTATMADALRTAVTAMRLSLTDAVHLVATTPARVLGLGDRGCIAPGLRADLCLLDGGHRVQAVMAAGEWLAAPPAAGAGSAAVAALI